MGDAKKYGIPDTVFYNNQTVIGAALSGMSSKEANDLITARDSVRRKRIDSIDIVLQANGVNMIKDTKRPMLFLQLHNDVYLIVLICIHTIKEDALCHILMKHEYRHILPKEIGEKRLRGIAEYPELFEVIDQATEWSKTFAPY